MNRRVGLVLLVLAALAVAPSVAHAGWQERRALIVAEAVWGPQSCGPLSLRYGTPSMFGVVDAAGGWATEGDCKIWLNEATRGEDFEVLCQKVLHEAGHVAGVGHSSNPRSVMRPAFDWSKASGREDGRRVTRWSGIDRRCLERGRPYLESRGLA